MRFLYGEPQERFVYPEIHNTVGKQGNLDTYQFRAHPFLKGRTYFDKNDIPIDFKTTPDTLLHLCARVVDAIPLPPVYTWSNVDVCVWLRKYGYPQYRNTFVENMINGRTLLLLDAAALSAMNIKNFDHIKDIAKGIRSLFFFELTKFGRSISLAPHYHYELFKLYRVKTGLKYEQVRRTDLWRKMQLLREKNKYYSHWELLEKWLSLKPDPIFQELFGGFHRFNLYRCRRQKGPPPPPPPEPVPCRCFPPCECHWTEECVRPAWRLKVLEKPGEQTQVSECTKCTPPCTCSWKPNMYNEGTILSCLREVFPQRYLHRVNNVNIKFRQSARISRYSGYQYSQSH